MIWDFPFRRQRIHWTQRPSEAIVHERVICSIYDLIKICEYTWNRTKAPGATPPADCARSWMILCDFYQTWMGSHCGQVSLTPAILGVLARLLRSEWKTYSQLWNILVHRKRSHGFQVYTNILINGNMRSSTQVNQLAAGWTFKSWWWIAIGTRRTLTIDDWRHNQWDLGATNNILKLWFSTKYS